jgi:hypothetical protein
VRVAGLEVAKRAVRDRRAFAAGQEALQRRRMLRRAERCGGSEEQSNDQADMS